jgi:hypothetical protein
MDKMASKYPIKGSWKYIGRAVADSYEGAILELGGWAGANTFTAKKIEC